MENSFSDNAFSAWKAFYLKTGKQPNALYLGSDEYGEFRKLAASACTVPDDKLNGIRSTYRGMEIYQVDAKSHLVVAII